MRTKFAAVAWILGSTLAPCAAHAAAIVIADAAAQSCYQAARNPSVKNGMAICSESLSSETLAPRARAGVYANRSVIRLRDADFAGALSDAETSLKLLPGLGEAHVNRGIALVSLNRPAEAIADLRRGLELGVSQPHVAYCYLGMAKELTGDIRSAYYDYKMSSELRPDFALAGEQLARFRLVKQAAASPLQSVATDRSPQ